MAWRPVVLLSSAARTATAASAVQITPNIERVVIVIRASAATATPSVTFTIRGYQPLVEGEATKQTYDILASNAVTAVGTTAMEVGPGLTAAANLVAGKSMPGEWDINAVHADADSITYSVIAWVYDRDS